MKKHMITGLVILLPVALTLMIIIFLFDLFTEPFFQVVGPLVEFIRLKLDISLPQGIILFFSRLLSLIFLCIFIFLLGLFTQVFLVKTLIKWGNYIILQIPFIKTVYQVSTDIFAAIFSSDGKKAFKNPVMIPFPCKPNQSLGFEAGELTQEIKNKIQKPVVSVFVPTAPHPISGFLFFIPEEDVLKIDMTNEEVVKFLVSCGMIQPESRNKQEPTDEQPV